MTALLMNVSVCFEAVIIKFEQMTGVLQILSLKGSEVYSEIVDFVWYKAGILWLTPQYTRVN